ncbi:MAG TPA: hypothetical protein ENJ22_06020 [Gammaproteobacteria bacterium]|nr:hypothetical protein [Gammaproteobacteria bacterium]
MDSALNSIMAFFFLLAGIVCIQRPRQLLAWLLAYFTRAGLLQEGPPGWAQGSGIILFIRILGFLSLLNFTMHLAYLLR